MADYYATSTGSSSDIRQRELLAKVEDPYNQLSGLNASLDGDDVAALVSTVSPVARQDIDDQPAGTEYQARLDSATGNGSEAMTSYRVARDTREAVTDYDFRDLTPATTADADVNRSYVAKLYRSWDDSFLPEVTIAVHSHFIFNQLPGPANSAAQIY